MATYSTTIKQFIVTASANADFRAIIAVWRAAFTAWGWAQAADSGQINPSTVNYPGSNNTDAGEEIWYFNDSLQSSYPVGIRIVYGRGADANDWRVKISVSMSLTNGSRVFTGLESGTLSVNGATAGTRTNADATAYRVAGSGDLGRGVISFFHDVISTPFGLCFSIERTKNSDGTNNGDGLHLKLFKHNTFAGGTSCWLDFDRRVSYTQSWLQPREGTVGYQFGANANIFGTTMRSQQDAASTLYLGKVYAFPFYPFHPGWKYPLMELLTCMLNDFPVDFSTVTIPFYGADRVYMPLGRFAGYSKGYDSSNQFLLMRYE